MRRLLAIASLSLLASCQAAPAIAGQDIAGPIPEHDGRGISVYIDPETGCEYLVTYDKGITARRSPTGEAFCGGAR